MSFITCVCTVSALVSIVVCKAVMSDIACVWVLSALVSIDV